MDVNPSIWTSILSGMMALLGVATTLLFTNRSQAATRVHERTMRQQEWQREAGLAEIARQREVYEEFAASIDGAEHAILLLYSARQVGKDPNTDPDISRIVVESTSKLYRARSRLSLYGDTAVIMRGSQLSNEALAVQAAYTDYGQWQVQMLQLREDYSAAVRDALERKRSTTLSTVQPNTP